jgi:hypothetical protein
MMEATGRVLLAALFGLAAGCACGAGGEDESPPVCGDGRLDLGEDCEGSDLRGLDCPAVDEAFTGGMLACTATCSFETRGCTAAPIGGDSKTDFNGDGYDDVVVGAYNYLTVGHAYVYFGGPGGTFDATADGALTAETAGDSFGFSVAPAGDVNGDGYADAIVGAPNTAGSGAGRAYLYFGGSGAMFEATANGTLTDEAADDGFGRSVASAGDVNGDGYADVVVGGGWTREPGRAYVYLGGPGGTFDATADGRLTGEDAGDLFGGSVASAGDVNGDGYADVIVGAAQRAYLYLGGAGPTFDANADGTIALEAVDATGNPASVASAGDVNGDGDADIVVGAAGSVLVYLGGPGETFDATADATLTGPAAVEGFSSVGPSVAPAGDVNADGYADIVVGSEGLCFWRGCHTDGQVYVYLGGAGEAFDATPDGTLTAGEDGSESFGAAVAPAGDVNGDGYADVIVGDGGDDTAGLDAGAAYVYLGGAGGTFDATADSTLTGSLGGQFGFSVGR